MLREHISVLNGFRIMPFLIIEVLYVSDKNQ